MKINIQKNKEKNIELQLKKLNKDTENKMGPGEKKNQL